MSKIMERASCYEPDEILELQMCSRELESELLGRYVSNPGNIEAMRRILKNAFKALFDLEKFGKAPHCPPVHWLHSGCKSLPIVCRDPRIAHGRPRPRTGPRSRGKFLTAQ